MTSTTRAFTSPLGLALALGLLSAQPSQGQVAVVGDMVKERVAEAGTTYQDSITIRNSASEPQRVRLSVSDFVFDAAGTSHSDPWPSHPRSNGAWITLSQELISIPPGTSVKVPYTVTVPGRPGVYAIGPPAVPPVTDAASGAEMSGTYWSAISVEGEGSDPVAGRSAPGVSLNVKLRYVVQVATHIGATGEAQLAFADPKIDGRKLLLDVTGSGTRACRPMLRVEIYKADGSLVKAHSQQRGLLYPTTSLRQVVELPTLTPGSYNVLLYADLGTEQVQGQKFQITVR